MARAFQEDGRKSHVINAKGGNNSGGNNSMAIITKGRDQSACYFSNENILRHQCTTYFRISEDIIHNLKSLAKSFMQAFIVNAGRQLKSLIYLSGPICNLFN